MLASLARSLPRMGRRWTPLSFTNTNFARVPQAQKVEEETWPDYAASHFYPTRIGQVIHERYQVVGKLGCGSTSTVWLARDMDARRHVMLKIFVQASVMGDEVDHELNMYKRVEQAAASGHPGRRSIRNFLDAFDIAGPDDRHRCLVHQPLWDSLRGLLYRNPVEKLPAVIVATALHRLLLALDYLHTECHMTHTDINADNMMLEFDDPAVFAEYERAELEDPTPRKEVDANRNIYFSRDFCAPRDIGAPVLCDLGSAVHGRGPHTSFIQPKFYRAPEVVLGVPWTFSADIWNVGCMVWDIFQGGSLFSGYDPDSDAYRSKAHLAQMIDLLGPPPPQLLARGEYTSKFFSSEGVFLHPELHGGKVTLEQLEGTIEDSAEREMFLRLMRKMLQWDPEGRSSARELVNDPWIQSYVKNPWH